MCATPRRHAFPVGAPIVGTSSKPLPAIAIVAFTSLWTLATSASPSSPNTDLQALSCLKLHLSSTSSRQLDAWNLNGSLRFCSWPGVTCLASRVVALDIESGGLDGQIPPCIGNLTLVTRIHFPGNQLTGAIPPEVGRLRRLSYLNLSSNSLAGSVPLALVRSSSLRVLDLTKNNLGGPIPPGLFNSSSLERLAIGWNYFVGSVPSVSPGVDSPLQSLALSVNLLTGAIPSSLGNFSSLRRLLLAGNNFEGGIPATISRLPNLQELDLSYNNLSGTVHPSLYNMSSLVDLRLSVNKLTGSIPSDIGNTLRSIRSLVFQGNFFQGQIPASLANATNLESVNLAQSAFSGVIPSFGSLSKLNQLILAANQLEAGDWSFLSSLANCTELVILSLGTNMIQGNLPSSVGSLAKKLQVLTLHENKISGSIPWEVGNLTNLMFLRMEQNYFVGNLPGSIGNIANLTFLSMSQNRLSGQIPVSIGQLRQLNKLFLQENNLSGSIPRSLGDCKTLINLNISYNSLNGSIPKELFSLYALSEGLDLSHNKLSGQIPQEIGGLINIGHMNFSDNHLSGQIPTTLGSCVLLETLRMEGNFLAGRLPGSFINLRGIAQIDLSRNNLTGEIPEFFESFNSLKLLNLSFNDLDGQIPAGGIFQNSSEIFVQGNSKLCSSVPMLGLPLCHGSSKHWRSSNSAKVVGISAALALVLLACVTCILLKRSKKKSKHPGDPAFNELKIFSYDDLVRATNGFSSQNLLGSGTYGSVYKGVLESEAQGIAIKVFKLNTLGAPKSFIAECNAFRNIRHRNIVRVISACSTWDHKGDDFKALIIEYMANGTLESWLYSKMENPLSLGSRVTIAVDIASALDYLHNHCVPPIVHCDLKPSNVLLDDGMGARLGDFGLAKFIHSSLNSTTSTTSLGPRGSIGYIAPEYGFGSKISTEGDVYSYGILILEMLTGKQPTDELFSNGLSLHKFVENAFPQKISDILDPKIIQSFGDGALENKLDHESQLKVELLSCIKQLIKLGLSCSMEAPKDRPTMVDVCAEVTAIKHAVSAICLE